MVEQESEDNQSSNSRPIRLQRVLAAAGLGSRRDCEQLILDGRVEVDGRPCTELGTRIDANRQKVLVDGERVRGQKLQYFMLNKPMGVLSTNVDPSGRARVIDFIKTDLRVFNVGRLDQSSEGLIIVTNDGDLTFRLTHPKFGVEKTYQVQVVGFPTQEQLEQLERGVHLAEGKAKAERVTFKKRNRIGAILEMVLTEGRNREIRRLFARIGHKVTRLKRIAIGPLELGDLPVGAHRKLTLQEVSLLQKAALGSAPKRGTAGPRRNSKISFASGKTETSRQRTGKPFRSKFGGPKRSSNIDSYRTKSRDERSSQSRDESQGGSRGEKNRKNKFKPAPRKGFQPKTGTQLNRKSQSRRGKGRFQRKSRD